MLTLRVAVSLAFSIGICSTSLADGLMKVPDLQRVMPNIKKLDSVPDFPGSFVAVPNAKTGGFPKFKCPPDALCAMNDIDSPTVRGLVIEVPIPESGPKPKNRTCGVDMFCVFGVNEMGQKKPGDTSDPKPEPKKEDPVKASDDKDIACTEQANQCFKDGTSTQSACTFQYYRCRK